MKKTVAIVGALDSKGEEFAYLKSEIEKRGCGTLVIDTGVLGEASFAPDISRDVVARYGGTELQDLIARRDRGNAVAVMTKGVAKLVLELFEAGKFEGIISMGGGAGTVIGTSAMRVLPTGFPKLMVSTIASGDISAYVGTTDITIMPSVVDVAGMNRISRRIYSNAAGAICGMVSGELNAGEDKLLIAASMFGNTTTAVNHAREIVEAEGYEVLVFHATGTGGRTMESLVADNFIAGVLDITTTEWADEVCGGVLSAGPQRLAAAAEAGIPQVVVPGCIDMCNFWTPDTVPEKYSDRLFYQWSPNVTLMRTTPEENQHMGKIFAEKLNASPPGRVVVLIPLKGFSQIDIEGGPFYWPEANQAFITALKHDLREDIPVIEVDYDINAPEFSALVAETLLNMLKK